MIIRLKEELIVAYHKTIDGRGVHVHIANGAGITIQFVKNVIIHGLYIHNVRSASGGTIRDSVDHFGFRTRSDGDGISIFGSANIWIDHISMRKCEDGLVDATMGSTAISLPIIIRCCLVEVIPILVINSCRLPLRSTILGRDWFRGCRGADGVSSMSLTMTTLTGLCMLLVVACILLSSARVTSLSLLRTQFPRRWLKGMMHRRACGRIGHGDQREI